MAKKTARNTTPVITSRRFCAARFPAPPKLPKNVSPQRARLIRETASRWLNGTPLRYWFFDKPAKWTAPRKEQDVVRAAFKSWKALGIGLDFAEVKNQAEADIRIAFQQDDGSWSYVGTDIRTRRGDARTMNFGWSLTEDPQDGMDTAIHEIGHTLGFPHEHQNPFAGIVWDEEAVYKSLAAPPNQWSRSTTFRNIIEKIVPDSVKGSNWDPDSVMHYPFEPGLILKPEKITEGPETGRRVVAARQGVGADVLPPAQGRRRHPARAVPERTAQPEKRAADRLLAVAGDVTALRDADLRQRRHGDGALRGEAIRPGSTRGRQRFRSRPQRANYDSSK